MTEQTSEQAMAEFEAMLNRIVNSDFHRCELKLAALKYGLACKLEAVANVADAWQRSIDKHLAPRAEEAGSAG